ncbi:MAG TPA: ribosome maturation factor RimM [Gemmatimonadaceae bacterium]
MSGDESQAPSGLVAVGRVRRSHGVRGVLVVEALTSGPEPVFAAGRRLFVAASSGEPMDSPRELHVEWAEPFQGGFRVQFSEITGREESDLWRNRLLLAPRGELPAPDETVFLLQNLIGLHVERANGDAVGTVEAYYELPHDVLIEVSRPVGSVLIPYREEFVTSVDLEAKRMVVEPPEGLL